MNELNYIPAGPEYVTELIVSKSSGTGIKVDLLSPTWGWRDILGQITAKGVGATDPVLNTFITNIKMYQFTVNDEVWITYHLPHDYVPGTDLFIHAHWAITTTAVETVTWGFDVSYAKGFTQAFFPATINKTVALATNGTAHEHYISEVQITGAGALTLADIEVDGLILARVYLSANTGAVEPFLFTADIHYQSNNIGTKQKTGPGFYT